MLPDTDFREYLKRKLSRTVAGTGNLEDLETFWASLVERGVWVGEPAKVAPPAADLTAVVQTEPPVSQDSMEYLFHLIPFETTGLGMGREANLPWLQELPDPMSSVVWGAWLEINPHTAAELGIDEHEWVWVESRSGRIRIPVLLSAAARPDTLSMPFGQGHGAYGRYASGRGVNPWEVLFPAQVRDAGEVAWADTRVNIRKTGEQATIVRIGNDRLRDGIDHEGSG
jgi:anaerobic selenocysteine-containing dehydrogenase